MGIFPALPRPMNILIFSSTTGELGRSTFNSWMASSMRRKLLMQIPVLERLQARTKFGMAMAASRLTVDATIMTSTKVKPRAGWFPFRFSVFTHGQANSN